MTHLRKFGYN